MNSSLHIKKGRKSQGRCQAPLFINLLLNDLEFILFAGDPGEQHTVQQQHTIFMKVDGKTSI